MTTRPDRRAFLTGALAAPAAAVLPVPAVDNIAEAARVLTDAMQARHGGQWRVTVDHTAEFVLIMRRPAKEGGAS